MMTETESPVVCQCCRRAVATKIVKDGGGNTFPACGDCISWMPVVTFVRSIHDGPCPICKGEGGYKLGCHDVLCPECFGDGKA